MTKDEAKIIAKKYRKHVDAYHKAIELGDKKRAQYHNGCLDMALQIFKEFNFSHGYGSPTHALEDTNDGIYS